MTAAPKWIFDAVEIELDPEPNPSPAATLDRMALAALLTRLESLNGDLNQLSAAGGLAGARGVAQPVVLGGLDRTLSSLVITAAALLHDPKWAGSHGRVDRRYRADRKEGDRRFRADRKEA